MAQLESININNLARRREFLTYLALAYCAATDNNVDESEQAIKDAVMANFGVSMTETEAIDIANFYQEIVIKDCGLEQTHEPS